jgi:predicted PurR-regulated permease PerM
MTEPVRRTIDIPAEPARRIVDISGRSIIRVLVTAVLVWLWLRLWQWVLLFVVAIFLTLALEPLVKWLEDKGLRRSYGASLVVLALAAMMSAFVYFAGASLVEQARMVGGRLSEFQQSISQRIPAQLTQLMPKGETAGSQIGAYITQLGSALMNGLLSVGIAFILTVYLLVDGRRTYEWLIAFVPRRRRDRVQETAVEARNAVVAYMRGNFITSVIAGVFTYVMLIAFGVPAALFMALLTAVCDFIPVLGFFISTIPTVALAFTVSAWTAVIVAALCVLYNVAETYYISPKVYGRALQLSSLAVIGAFAVGAELGGVVGALIALPIAAMYPTIESIWLVNRVGPEAVEEHRRIEQSEEH